jgi:regulator of sigma E protease
VTPPPVVRHIVPGGAAEAAGLQPGDRIVSFDGNTNPKWKTIADDALLSPGQPLPLQVERNGQRLSLNLTPTPHTEEGETVGFLGFLPDYGNVPIVVRLVEPNTPAAEAGLRVGDRIVSVNGETVKSAEQVTQYIREHKGQAITLRVNRGGTMVDITATPRLLDPQENRERLGFQPDEELPYQKIGIIGSFSEAVDINLEYRRLTGTALGQVIAGKRSVRNTCSGPHGFYRVASTAAIKVGWAGIFATLGFLSLNLGIFNLLPIPVLDGGAIFLLLIEGALATVGWSISSRVRDRIQQVGFVVVILLMVFVITNDLIKQASIWRGGDSSPPATTSPAPK